MKQELNSNGKTALSDDMIVTWFLDPAISYPGGPGQSAVNSEPLLINTTGSLDDQPDSKTAIPNLFLAADYVRNNVSLATMEGANEAAWQAVKRDTRAVRLQCRSGDARHALAAIRASPRVPARPGPLQGWTAERARHPALRRSPVALPLEPKPTTAQY